MTQSSTTTTLPLHQLHGKKRPRSDGDSCSVSPRKRPASRAVAAPAISALRFGEPPDVTELRRRIENRETSFHGLELCPWAQTSVAMLTAVEASAGTGSNHLVRWLIKVDNPHWFTVGLRTAVQRHHNHIVRDLLGHAAFWPERLLRSSSSSSSCSKNRRSANSSVFRAISASSSSSGGKKARLQDPTWGPFSSDYYGQDDDGDDDAVPECAIDDSRFAPALLMLDALLHGNRVAAELIMSTFVSSAWNLEGSWTVGSRLSSSGGDDVVPPTLIQLGKKRFRATGRVPCSSASELIVQVKDCLLACQGKMGLVQEKYA